MGSGSPWSRESFVRSSKGIVKIGSTHNFCPLPTGVIHAAPNLFEPSAVDTREHEQWLRHTKRSIDFAAQVRAKVLVCHLGSVPFFWFNPEKALNGYVEGHRDTDLAADKRYQKLLTKSLAKVRKRMGPYWAADAGQRDRDPRLCVRKGRAVGV